MIETRETMVYASLVVLLICAGCDGGKTGADDTTEEDSVADVTDDVMEEEIVEDVTVDEVEDASALGGLGDLCEAPSDCEGGVCITDLLFPGFEDGYCTILGCDPLEHSSCGEGGYCLDMGGSYPTLCVKTCEVETDCVDGQACIGMCLPDCFVSDPTPTDVIEPTDTIITDAMAQVDESRLLERIETMSGARDWDSLEGTVTIHSRAAAHPDHALASDYLEALLSDMGFTVTRLEFYVLGLDYVNLVATLTGTDVDADPVFVTAHYDSTAGFETDYDPTMDSAPGACDNGSGTGIVLELASILSNIHATDPPPRDIVFILFDGEEDSMLGSYNYVAGYHAAGGTLLCQVNIDMVGWDPDASPGRYWYSFMPADEDVAAFGLEAIGDFVPEAMPIPSSMGMMGDSDHVPFWEEGYCAISLTSYPPDPSYHSYSDVIANYDWDFYMTVVQSTVALVTAMAYDWPR